MHFKELNVTEKFQSGWGKFNFFKDREILFLFIYLLIVLILNFVILHLANNNLKVALNYSLNKFISLGIASLIIAKILKKNHFFLVFLLFIISFFSGFYLNTLKGYPLIGILLTLYLFLIIIFKFPEKAKELGLTFDNWKRDLLLGIFAGAVLGCHAYFTITISGNFKIFSFSFYKYIKMLCSGIYTITIGEIFVTGIYFNTFLRKGLNYWSACIIIYLFIFIFAVTTQFHTSAIEVMLGTAFYTLILTVIKYSLFYYTRSIISLIPFWIIFLSIISFFGIHYILQF